MKYLVLARSRRTNRDNSNTQPTSSNSSRPAGPGQMLLPKGLAEQWPTCLVGRMLCAPLAHFFAVSSDGTIRQTRTVYHIRIHPCQAEGGASHNANRVRGSGGEPLFSTAASWGKGDFALHSCKPQSCCSVTPEERRLSSPLPQRGTRCPGISSTSLWHFPCDKNKSRR